MVDPTADHMKGAIFRWVQKTPQQYAFKSRLRDIWDSKYPSVDYQTEGIRLLHYHFGEDPFFSACPSFQGITPGELVTGGDLQTVEQLYYRLQGCVQTQLAQDFAQEPDKKA